MQVTSQPEELGAWIKRQTRRATAISVGLTFIVLLAVTLVFGVAIKNHAKATSQRVASLINLETSPIADRIRAQSIVRIALDSPSSSPMLAPGVHLEVYFNSALVAQSNVKGSLIHFDWLIQRDAVEYAHWDGTHIKIATAWSMGTLIAQLCLCMGFVFAFSIGGTYLYRRFFERALSRLLAEMVRLAKNPRTTWKASPAEPTFEVREMQAIRLALLRLVDAETAHTEARIELSNAEEQRQLMQQRLLLAKKIAHDIRAPADILESVLDSQLDEANQRQIVSECVQRLKTFATALSKGTFEPTLTHSNDQPGVLDLKRFVFQKSLEHQKTALVLWDAESTFVGNPRIPGSKDDWFRVLSNMINNACEACASAEYPQVTVRVCHTEQSLNVTVADNGCGMSDETIERLGTPGFSHGKSGHKESGSGLGVAGSMEIISRLGGAIIYQSKLGVGTTATIQIPRES